MANFTTDDYFSGTPPDKWQLGRFADYCYQLPGFPGKGQRKRLAQKLWVNQLQRLSENSEHARRLLQGLKKEVHVHNNITITGDNNPIITNVNVHQDYLQRGRPSSSQAPPPYSASKDSHEHPRKQPCKRNRSQATNEGSDSASASSTRPDSHKPKRNRMEAKYVSPPTRLQSRFQLKPEVQPVRQRLLKLKDTLITQSHSTSTKSIEETLSHLYEVRSTIDRLIGDLEQTRKSFPNLCSEVHQCLDGIANDPLLVNDDYLLTEKDDTSEAETVVV
ncbi:hypothetical protein BGX38DRAFT_1271608 [Terfezia claveryi]|nr:hypothetical protein BGX38DRAFT_1271608 [Terfezia claveryi]